jgi:hypothetical protein
VRGLMRVVLQREVGQEEVQGWGWMWTAQGGAGQVVEVCRGARLPGNQAGQQDGVLMQGQLPGQVTSQRPRAHWALLPPQRCAGVMRTCRVCVWQCQEGRWVTGTRI